MENQITKQDLVELRDEMIENKAKVKSYNYSGITVESGLELMDLIIKLIDLNLKTNSDNYNKPNDNLVKIVYRKR